MSDDIRQFRHKLIELKNIPRSHLPKTSSTEAKETAARGASKRYEKQSNLLNEQNCQINLPKNSSKVSKSSSEDIDAAQIDPNTSFKEPNTADDPSAPTYPPRSPTSDIVPNELPPCHLYPRVSKMAEVEDIHINQLDGSMETPKEDYPVRHLSGSSVEGDQEKKSYNCLSHMIVPEDGLLEKIESLATSSRNTTRENDDIMALLGDKKGNSKNIRHSFSSSSVSSIGSTTSSSVRESMSDTVSIRSNSSGYGSECYEVNSECDFMGSTDNLSYNPKMSIKKNNADRVLENCNNTSLKPFDRFVCKNDAKCKTGEDRNDISYREKVYKPFPSKFNNRFSNAYQYQDGELVQYPSKFDKNVKAKHSSNVKDLNHTNPNPNGKQQDPNMKGEEVLSIESLLRNAGFNDCTNSYDTKKCIDKRLG